MTHPSPRTALTAALTLVFAMGTPAAAQDEPVPYLDAEGTQLGAITIRDFADPYTDFDATRPPAEGMRYALLTVTFEAAETQAFPTDPNQIQLQDAGGFLYFPAFVPRRADSPLPDLQGQTLAPFDRVSGVIGYNLPLDAEVVRILYRGDGSRLMAIAEPGSSGASAVGQPRDLTAADGTPLGTITIREMVDPYTDFEPSRPPTEGQRYVLLTTAFEAAEDQALYADPRLIYLVDDLGIFYRPSPLPRPAGALLQDLDIQPLSPGDRVSGVLGYQIPADAVVESIAYGSESNRFIPVADLGATAVQAEPAVEASPAVEGEG